MTTATFTSRDFNREPGHIKRAAANGPVFVTDRGKPSIVVLSHADYQRLSAANGSLLEALAMPGLSAIDLDTSLPTSGPTAATFD